MSIAKKKFFIQLSDDNTLDMADIPEHDWAKIKTVVKHLVKSKVVMDPGRAYAIAFTLWLEQFAELSVPFDKRFDTLN